MKNKNIYVNKYDYIGFYTKQPSLWFLSNQIINSIFETKINFYKNKNKPINISDDEEDDDLSDYEFDSYDFFKQQMINNEDIDLNNPKILEGKIIDQKSRDFVCRTYEEIDKIVDLEKEYPQQYRNNDFLFNKTKELLLMYENIIIFQSVFINNCLITKPDAIVKQKNKLILIETKGTTTAKLHHALDIYYQAQILNNLSYLSDFEIDYKICLVAYQKANKNDVPFILSDNFNYTKTVSFPSFISKFDLSSQLKYKQMVKCGDGLILNKEKEIQTFPISFNCICNNSVEDFEYKYENIENSISKQSLIKAIKLFKNIFNNFSSTVKILHEKKQLYENEIKPLFLKKEYFNIPIEPSYNDKGDFKNSDYWLIQRKLYQLMGYELFNYSGNVVDQSNTKLVNLSKQIDFNQYVKKTSFINLFKKQYDVNLDNTKIIFSKLKTKKVYFDFETINTAIRPLDKCLPFMQIVTQCSIIILDNNIPIKDLICNNLLYDPKKININDFKAIVDALYKGEDYSYVVYNKSFEATRLKEFIIFINDEAYTKKINVIINNLFDLADFFNICSKQGHSIFINELGGYYSIKKVLPLIEKYKPEIYLETGCKDYNDLAITNGLVAQNETTLRFLSTNYSDEKWKTTGDQLKIYCENDVRAMIAVELFVKWIVSNIN